MAVNAERRHLHFRERATHAVPVDDAEPRAGRRNDGSERVATADLARDQRVDLLAEVFLQGAQRAQPLVTLFELFDRDDRCADATNGDHVRVVRQLIETDQRYLSTGA